jgi:pimeloyl-ACP methyl ester carboxylesterase
MPFSHQSGASVYFETMGPRTDEPLVFIEGLSAQMIGWREPFCQAFVDRGFWVIRLDNRDVGLSQKFGGPAEFDGRYDISDMARDVFGVLDALGLNSAHVVGQSMGGMIAQTMAIADPWRVRSMTLFYTAPSSGPYVGDDLTEHLAKHRETNPHHPREQVIDEMVESQRFCASTAYPFDEAWIRELAGLRYDRCHCPAGPLRQYAAARRAPDRLPALSALETSTAIIQGRADRLIKLESALDMAKALQNSELHVFPGMGHEIARPLWEDFTRIIERTAGRATSPISRTASE